MGSTALQQGKLNFQPIKVEIQETKPTQHRNIPIAGVPVQFPFQPYPAQIQMMSKIVQALKKSENALLESPTGSGKSLALLCGALAWREHQVKNIAEQVKKEQGDMEANRLKAWKEYTETRRQLSATVTSQNLLPGETVQRQQEKQQKDHKGHQTHEKSKSIMTKPLQETHNHAEGKDSNDNGDDDDDDDFQPMRLVKRRRLQPATVTKTESEETWEITAKDIQIEPENSLPATTEHIDHTRAMSSSSSFQPSASALKLAKQAASSIQRMTENIPKIYVCSRTHKQIEQLIGELKEFTSYRPRMTVLGSRDQLCVHPKVSKSATKSDDCTALLDAGTCIYGKQTSLLLRHSKMRSGNIWDIEDTVKLGKRTKGCPYYGTRALFDTAELIFCPYNYVIDPIIRNIMDINVKGNIVIFDEAHNIEDVARSVGSYEVTEADLRRLQKELNQVIHGQHLIDDHNAILFIVDTLFEWITKPDNSFDIKEYEKHVHIWSGAQILSKLSDLHINATTFDGTIYPAYKNVKAHADKIRNEAESASVTNDMDTQAHGKHTQECVTTWGLRHFDGLFMVLRFLFQEGYDRSSDYSMALIKKVNQQSIFMKGGSSWVFKLGFWCHNPGVVFQELSSLTHSMILTSGTLSPLGTFASELDTKFNAILEANHVIHPSQVWVGTIPIGPSGATLRGVYSVVETFQYQDDIGQALLNIVNIVPFGVLCFLPSYATLDKLIKRWKVTDIYSQLSSKKKVFIEPHGDNKQMFQKQLKDFYSAVKDVHLQTMPNQDGCTGALFFAVYRGKVSEGIDFSNNDCRAVVAVGIPYPNLKDTQISLKRSYNDTKKRLDPSRNVIGGDDWYTVQGFRAINQALGRCIRHKKDWGAIILLEERFKQKKNIDGLSKWIQKLCKIYPGGFDSAMESLQTFIQDRLSVEAGLVVDLDI